MAVRARTRKKTVKRAAPKPMAQAAVVKAQARVPVAPQLPDEGPLALPARGYRGMLLANMGWRDRLWQWLGRRTTQGGKVSREQMADVQAAVLNELAHLKQSGKSPVSGRPFESVILPPAKRPLWKRMPGGQRRWLLKGLGVLLVALLLGVLVYQGRTPPGPTRVLDDLRVSLAQHDLAAFETVVDVAGIASSAVNQLFGPGQLGMAQLDPAMRAPLEKVLSGSVRGRMELFVKPGLAESLKDDMLTYVETGALPEGGLLHQLWLDAGAENLRVGKPQVVQADARRAAAEVPLRRKDLDLLLPLRLEMVRERGQWQVVDVPNLADVLERMTRTSQAKVVSDNSQALGELARLVRVTLVTKAKTEDGMLLVRLQVTNTGPMTLKDMKLQLQFGDAAGTPMKVVTLDEALTLAIPATLDKTWTVPVDASKRLERYVRDLPVEALSVKAGVVGVTLPGGRKVSTMPAPMPAALPTRAPAGRLFG